MSNQKHCPSCGYTEEDAKFHMDHGRCKNAGNAPWEKRGQNAAESLPAQPEPKRKPITPCVGDPAGTGFCEFHECENDCQSVESLPVEAKEKCGVCNKPIEKIEGEDRYRHVLAANESYIAQFSMYPECFNKPVPAILVAEPKPTPSALAEPEAQPLPARVGSVAAYIGITEDQVRRFVGAMNMVGLEIVETSRLSQPASISSEETWIDLPTSSGYWWHHDGNPDLRPFIYHVQISFTGSPRYFIDFPDSRWCDEVGGKWMKVIQAKGWAAAKGSTETEGR